ncbi:MAG: tRNA pseudouridine(55) synthase TruB [Burkholderiaceae bacterium]|nr:tRNA pseudouridine(55) synthase TruB [Burkholderiaceae bacterium]
MPPKKPQREPVDGILLLDKPKGLTSNDALVRARRLLNARKAGHGGTLDPMASGLLPLLFGEATKFAHDSLDADKTYLAELTLGTTTDTGDAEGEVLSRREVDCDDAAFRAAAAAFVGEIEQVPPMHSALKRDGRPLYEYARAGIVLERAARRVTIRSIETLACAGSRATIRVCCSKGTYIRTLAADIGERLGCGAHLSALRRERVGALSLADAVSLDALEALEPAARRARLAPADALLAGLPRVELDAPSEARFLHGQKLRAPSSLQGGDIERVRVYGPRRLLGVAALRAGALVPLRLVATGDGEPTHPEPEAPHEPRHP